MAKSGAGVFVSGVCYAFSVSDVFAKAMRLAASALFAAPSSTVILLLLLIVGAIPGRAQNGTGDSQLPPCGPNAPAPTKRLSCPSSLSGQGLALCSEAITYGISNDLVLI